MHCAVSPSVFHSSTKIQVGNGADVNPLSLPLLVILPSFVIAPWHGVDRWGWNTVNNSWQLFPFIGRRHTMTSLILLFPDWVQIEVMTSYDSSDSLSVCIVDPQYVGPDPMCLSQITEGGWGGKKIQNAHPVFTPLLVWLKFYLKLNKCTWSVSDYLLKLSQSHFSPKVEAIF